MICIRCNRDKSLEYFHPDRRYNSGYSVICETCVVPPTSTIILCNQCKNQKSSSAFYKHKPQRGKVFIHLQPCKACRVINKAKTCVIRKAQEAGLFILPTTLQCQVCKQVKPLASFPPDKRTQTGYGQPCLTCNSPYRCHHCKQEKPLREFRVDTRWRIGHTSICNTCHLTQDALRSSRRRARKRGLPNTFTKTEQEFMLRYFAYACAVCGNQEGFLWTVVSDHWIPLSSPQCPGTIATNMIPLCHAKQGEQFSCNGTKYNRAPLDWLRDRVGAYKANRIMKQIAVYFDIVQQRILQKTG